MAIPYPHVVRSALPRFRTTSPGEDLWLSLRDLYVLSSSDAFRTLELIELPSWLEPSGIYANHHIDAAITTTVYRLMKAAKRIQREAELDGQSLADHVGEMLVTDGIWRHMVEHMEFSALDPTPRRIVPYQVYKCLRVTNLDISRRERAAALEEAEGQDGSIRCYCCGDFLWSRISETPRDGISLDHVWPRTLGGTSVASNLLPICDSCNGAKQDRASWGVFGVVFDHSLAERGPQAELLLGLALHRYAAGALAESRGLTLKEAYVELGPRTTVEMIEPAADRHFFNLSAHDRDRLGSNR